ncbi:MAG: hypothetical protein U0996_20090 [Planctomycetaceae bacterium]
MAKGVRDIEEQEPANRMVCSQFSPSTELLEANLATESPIPG